MTVQKARRWYQQPWVWLLIALPATAVVGGMITLYLAVTTSDGLVVDDYYTRGLHINRDLARDHAAQTHGIEAHIDIDMAANRVTVILASHDYELPRTLKLSFLHPTLPGRDQQVTLEQTGEGQYAASIGELSRGKWYIQMEADDWRLAGQMNIPLTASVHLSPLYTDESTGPS